mgnify:CR=1 FL=1|tara:strand:- start:1469 stop:3136 length:1668 start_codon:yes stop_codon:yes gene_type:complete
MMNYKIFSVLAAIWLVGGCGEGRPDGEIVDSIVVITAEAATDDGTPIGSAGITASLNIQVTGSMTDIFGIESSTYSWSGGPTLALPLDDAGGFTLDLTLQSGDNELVLEGTSVVGEEISTLVLTFVRDAEPPTIQLPDETFAASITGEGEMDIDKESTAFTLSGGNSVVVRSGVTFSKFSSTWGPGQPNRLAWRFNLLDNHETTNARMEFRVFRETADGEDVVVDWTSAALGEESDFEVTIGTELSERFSKEDGVFVMELRGFDSAGLPSQIATTRWTQNILNPPLFIATGDELLMHTSGGETDPRSYVIGQNFSSIASEDINLQVGSLLVGNPNNVPVMARLESINYAPEASYKSRVLDAPVLLPAPASFSANAHCGTNPTTAGVGTCFTPHNRADRVVRRHEGEALLTFDIYTSAGIFVSRGTAFIMNPNSEYVAIASPVGVHSNLPEDLRDAATLGPYVNNATYEELAFYLNCPGTPVGNVCPSWNYQIQFAKLEQYFATWEFSSRIQSRTDLELDSAIQWGDADPDTVVGYSRELSSASSNFSLPTSHDSI